MSVRILRGDVRDRLRDLPDESVHCVVTSPPYWGLRDYGMAGQLGLEDSPQAFVDTMVDVFREVRRVLRGDGTAWVNMGDSYCAAPNGNVDTRSSTLTTRADGTRKRDIAATGRLGGTLNKGNGANAPHRAKLFGLKPKDLIGMPWRLAFALQADGWWLRQDIVWHKPNPMPESVTDRCTKAHEYIFLLSKSGRYYYDQEAIRTPFSEETKALSFETMDYKARDRYKMPDGWATHAGGHGNFHKDGREKGKRNTFARETKESPGEHGQKPQHRPDRDPVQYAEGANKRSVWTVATEAFPGAHFATFPTTLIEPCILAGCPVGGTVLDPFGGAGTTGLVADRLQRDAILIELNPEYADMAERRIRGDSPLFAQVGT